LCSIHFCVLKYCNNTPFKIVWDKNQVLARDLINQHKIPLAVRGILLNHSQFLRLFPLQKAVEAHGTLRPLFL
jgi:hypothetical protein